MNVVIYSDNKETELKNILEDIDEINLRVEPAAGLPQYKDINASVIILDMPLDKIKETSAITKFDACVLVLDAEIPDMTIRAIVHDFIKRPFNNIQLKVRFEALLTAVHYKHS